jgi:hypothetical protein
MHNQVEVLMFAMIRGQGNEMAVAAFIYLVFGYILTHALFLRKVSIIIRSLLALTTLFAVGLGTLALVPFSYAVLFHVFVDWAPYATFGTLLAIFIMYGKSKFGRG